MPVHMPPEWAPQEWIWIGFPHDGSLWLDDLIPAQEQMAAFANAVAETGQQVRLVVRNAANEARARELVSGAVSFERHAYGDIWLRDSGLWCCSTRQASASPGGSASTAGAGSTRWKATRKSAGRWPRPPA